MTGDDLRARNRARTRDDIVEAALGLFERRGYDATTCDDIAAAAGVATRTFFRYFAGKADVLSVGRVDDTGPLAALAELDERPAGEDPVDAVRHAFDHPVRALEEQSRLTRRQFQVILSTPSLQEMRREPFHRYEDELAVILARRVGAERVDMSSRWLAAVCVAALRLSIEEWVATGAEPGRLGPILDQALALTRQGADRLDPPSPAVI